MKNWKQLFAKNGQPTKLWFVTFSVVILILATGMIMTVSYFAHKSDMEGINSIKPYFGDKSEIVYLQTEEGKQVMYRKFQAMAQEAKTIRRNIEYDRGGTRISYPEFSGYYGANRYTEIVEQYDKMSHDVFIAPFNRFNSDRTIKTPFTCLDIDWCN